MNEVLTTRMGEFREALLEGINGIVKASEIYVKAIDANPDDAETFHKEFADLLPSSAWSRFEAVGRKQMHPRLLMGGVQSPKKTTAIKRLPYSTQDKVMNHARFPLLLENGDTLQVSILDASDEHVKQLCDGDHIRTLAEQKSYIETEKRKPNNEPAEVMPYTIQGGRVRFLRNTVLTRVELKRLLQEM